MIAGIQSPINPADLKLNDIDKFIEEIANFVPQIQKQLTTVDFVINEIKQSRAHILEDVLQQLNLTGHLSAVNDFWKDLNSQVGGIENDLGNVVNSVETHVPEMSRYVAIGLYAIGGLFVLMTVVAVFACGRLLFRGYMLRLDLTSQIGGAK